MSKSNVFSNPALQIFLACLIPNFGAWSVYFALGDRVDIQERVKSFLDPPGWFVIAAWTYLYISMGFASWRVWSIGGTKAKIPLLIYIIKLVFNWAWLLIAFGFDWLLGAIIDTVALLALIVLTCFLFYKIDKVAGFLFIPYFIYLSYVLVLCSHIYIINN